MQVNEKRWLENLSMRQETTGARNILISYGVLVCAINYDVFFFIFVVLTMTVNLYIRVISSSLTPGFDPLYTQTISSDSRFRLRGKSSRKLRSERDRPNRALRRGIESIMRKPGIS